MKISVVLPTYNEASWLPETIRYLSEAVSTEGIQQSELILVDDGSTDDTKQVAKTLKTKIPIVYLAQQNKGRFLARKAGIEKAKYENILLIDSRVHIHKQSLRYLSSQTKKNPEEKVWNAHVEIDRTSNVLAIFWDVVAKVAWRKYFQNPRHVSYGVKEFDYYPKGTTCFYAPKDVLLSAIKIFKSQATDLKRANDDTALIMNIAGDNNIHLSPEFSCTYNARSTMKKFLVHSYHRGQVFVDGFLKKGNRFFYPLLLFMAVTVAAVVMILIKPLILLFLPFLIILYIGFLFLASRLFRAAGITVRDSFWFSILAIPFTVFYGAGIWVAVITKFLRMHKVSR